MKTATKLFSIEGTRYFPCQDESLLGENIWIDGKRFQVVEVKENEDTEKITFYLQLSEKKKEPKWLIPKKEQLNQIRINTECGTRRNINGADCCVVKISTDLFFANETISDSIIFYNKISLLLSRQIPSMSFAFMDRDLEGYVNAEGKVLENKHFSSMDVLIAEKAFDYAFKNIDSFEVIKN